MEHVCQPASGTIAQKLQITLGLANASSAYRIDLLTLMMVTPPIFMHVLVQNHGRCLWHAHEIMNNAAMSLSALTQV